MKILWKIKVEIHHSKPSQSFKILSLPEDALKNESANRSFLAIFRATKFKIFSGHGEGIWKNQSWYRSFQAIHRASTLKIFFRYYKDILKNLSGNRLSIAISEVVNLKHIRYEIKDEISNILIRKAILEVRNSCWLWGAQRFSPNMYLVTEFASLKYVFVLSRLLSWPKKNPANTSNYLSGCRPSLCCLPWI